MHVQFMQYIITAVLAMYGLTPAWCDSCGESYLSDQMTYCDCCGATICPVCDDLYEGVGCYVCDGNAANIGTTVCESCGEPCMCYDMTTCPNCNANICTLCDLEYVEHCENGYIPGCYVCNSNQQ